MTSAVAGPSTLPSLTSVVDVDARTPRRARAPRAPAALLLLLLRVDLAEEVERLGVLRVVVLEAAQARLDVAAVIRDGAVRGAAPGAWRGGVVDGVELGMQRLAASGTRHERRA